MGRMQNAKSILIVVGNKEVITIGGVSLLPSPHPLF